MRKTYKVNDLIYTLEGSPYGSTLSYKIFCTKTNKSIELNSLKPYQRYLLCMCHENFNSGEVKGLQENGILIIDLN